MTKVKIALDTRKNSQDKDDNFPLVLRISHKSKTRDIGFDIHIAKENFIELDVAEGEKKSVHFQIKGVANSVRKTKRIQKTYGDVDLWLDENKGEIKIWPINLLKKNIEKKFFNKQSQLSLLEHGAKMLCRFEFTGVLAARNLWPFKREFKSICNRKKGFYGKLNPTSQQGQTTISTGGPH